MTETVVGDGSPQPAAVTTAAPRGLAETGTQRAGARQAPRRRRRVLGLLALLLAALLGGGLFWWYQLRAPQDLYLTEFVIRGDIEDSTAALGNLQPREYVDVGTQVSGQLKKLHVEVGQTVKAGDLLAEIDPTVYLARVDADKAQLLNLRAQLADKEAQLVLAEQQLRRQTNLMKANATSEDALQNAAAAAKSAAAQVAAIKAQIQQTESTLKGDEANLGYTNIYAPMAGTVVSQTAKQGQTLNANQQAPIILRIADLSTMTVLTQVSEADIARLRLGMDAYFTTLGRPERRWYGKLRQILPTPEVVNNVVLYSALFDVENPDQQLMTQMSAQVFFVSGQAKNALLVPVGALRPAGEGRGKRSGTKPDAASGVAPGEAAAKPFRVQVMTPEGKVEDRRVSVGITNRISAEILSGLEEGERVVVGLRQAGVAAPAQNRPQRTPRL